MHRRAFIQQLGRLGVAGAAAAFAGRWIDDAFGQSLRVDRRPTRDVLSFLLTYHQPLAAVTTDAGEFIRYDADGRKLMLKAKRIEGTLDLITQLQQTSWIYRGRLPALGGEDPQLQQYSHSAADATYARDELLGGERTEQREWFLEHEAQLRDISDLLRGPLERGWDARSHELAYRVSLLRGAFRPDSDVELVSGEAYKLRVAGSEDTTGGDSLELSYELPFDRFTLTLRLAPQIQGLEQLAGHSETVVLTGDRSGALGRFQLTRWTDETLAVTCTPDAGGDHPAYADKQEAARALVGMFPQFL